MSSPLSPESVDFVPENLLVTDAAGRVVQANARAEATFSPPGAWPTFAELFPFRDPDTSGDAPAEEIARDGRGRELRVLLRGGPGPAGTKVWLITDLTRQQDDRQGMIDYMADLTSAQARIREYTHQIEVFRQVVDGMDQGVILTDADQRVGFSNAFANRLFGLELTGRKVGELKGLLQAVSATEEPWMRGEVLVLDETVGRQTRCYLNVAPLEREGNVTGMVVWTFFELTEEIANTQAFIDFSAELAGLNRDLKASNARILHLSRTDALTGAANRQTILEVLGKALDFGRSHNQPVSVVHLDLDQLKYLNARLGQSAGDEALVRVNRTVQDALGEAGTLGRFGGGEFLAVMPGLSGDQLSALTEQLRQSVARSTGHPGGPVTVSVGWAQWTADESLERLLQRADAALAAAKDSGGNQVVAG